MNSYFYNNLQIREVFHIEFLRALTRKMKPSFYALKGGVNMRLFFGSIRYSEDMDVDVNTISVSALRDTVMKIIGSASFQNELKSFGIEKVLPPDMAKAKQTGAKIACEYVFSVSFHQFRDTVLSYLTEEDKATYDRADLWDEIKLKVHDLICENN